MQKTKPSLVKPSETLWEGVVCKTNNQMNVQEGKQPKQIKKIQKMF